MIKSKPKISYRCTNCNADHVQWYGKCHFCKLWNTICEVTPQNTKSDLDIFFEFARTHALDNGLCKCENCGDSVRSQLNSKDTWLWRGAIAHVLPKKTFKSISTHVHNYMILCILCHSQYDSSWLNASKMPCFAIAKKKYQLFKSCITESKTKIEKYFES